ncbi:unnamed protein product [Closterium sp. Yama58-4]|nr:unnamed protein product [Closterium sp. Yama58-4]
MQQGERHKQPYRQASMPARTPRGTSLMEREWSKGEIVSSQLVKSGRREDGGKERRKGAGDSVTGAGREEGKGRGEDERWRQGGGEEEGGEKQQRVREKKALREMEREIRAMRERRARERAAARRAGESKRGGKDGSERGGESGRREKGDGDSGNSGEVREGSECGAEERGLERRSKSVGEGRLRARGGVVCEGIAVGGGGGIEEADLEEEEVPAYPPLSRSRTQPSRLPSNPCTPRYTHLPPFSPHASLAPLSLVEPGAEPVFQTAYHYDLVQPLSPDPQVWEEPEPETEPEADPRTKRRGFRDRLFGRSSSGGRDKLAESDREVKVVHGRMSRDGSLNQHAAMSRDGSLNQNGVLSRDASFAQNASDGVGGADRQVECGTEASSTVPFLPEVKHQADSGTDGSNSSTHKGGRFSLRRHLQRLKSGEAKAPVHSPLPRVVDSLFDFSPDAAAGVSSPTLSSSRALSSSWAGMFSRTQTGSRLSGSVSSWVRSSWGGSVRGSRYGDGLSEVASTAVATATSGGVGYDSAFDGNRNDDAGVVPMRRSKTDGRRDYIEKGVIPVSRSYADNEAMNVKRMMEGMGGLEGAEDDVGVEGAHGREYEATVFVPLKVPKSPSWASEMGMWATWGR